MSYFFHKWQRTLIVALCLGLLVVALGAMTASADTVTVDFESFALGTVDGQDGWQSDGAAGSGCAIYDHAVVNNTFGFPSFGTKSLRISNAVTSGCFSDQTFSKSTIDEVGETSAVNGGLSGGTRQDYFEAEWDFASTVPGSEQVGLSLTVSPDRGDGARMSWVQMADKPSGLEVNFYEYDQTADPACSTGGVDGFVFTNLVSGLDRTVPHTIKLTMNFVDGVDNDIVRVYVDGNLEVTGGSWEDYFRDCEGNPTRTVDSLLFRTGGAAAPATAGYGFAIDNLSQFTGAEPCTTVCYADAVGGNDANGGTSPADAKKTIQAAVNQVTAGGQVIAAPGVYIENVTIPKSLTLTGAGQTDDATGTVLDGSSLTGKGIYINSSVTDVTIEDLRIEDYKNASGSGIWADGSNDNFTVQDVTVDNNGIPPITAAGGIFMNGPVDNVLIDRVTANNNNGRGIVIWNGFKTNITITNNTVTGNNCCGIELQDGTASGVTVTGNTVSGNADSGMAFTGLTSGAGPNLISGNTLSNNGRFGMEIKLANGTGLATGDGSIVVENNNVSLTTPSADLRDFAGIAVFRRGWLAGSVDIPTGVIVRNNTVSGYAQNNAFSNSEGFGIVVEGTNMHVTGNTLNNNEVGAQVQGGHLPYTANTNIDGDQSNLVDQFFGRGNSPVGCAAVSGNTFSGNMADFRTVGTGGGLVTNVNTGETFCSIQSAIDDSDTVNGHTIVASPGVYLENVIVNKSLTIKGANAGVSPNDPITPLTANPARGPESEIPVTGNGVAFRIQVADVTIDGFKFTDSAVGQADIQTPIIGAGGNYGGDAPGFKVINNLFFETSRILVYSNGPNQMAKGTIDDNRAENPGRADTGCGATPTLAPSNCGYQLFNPWRVDGLSFQGNVTVAAPGNGDRVRTLNIFNSTDVTVADNTIRNTCTYSCFNIGAGTSGNVEVTGNDVVTDVGNVIQIHSSWTTTGATINVHHNVLTTGNDFPIVVDNATADLDKVHINRNSITGGAHVRNGTSDLATPGLETLDVECNWWQSAAGPNPVNFFGPSDFTPWLLTNDLDGPCVSPELILTPSYLVSRVVEGATSGDGSMACYWITLPAAPAGNVVVDIDPNSLLTEVLVNKAQVTLNAANWNNLTTANNTNFVCIRAVDDKIDESENVQCGDKSAAMTGDVLPHGTECGDHFDFIGHTLNTGLTTAPGYGAATPWTNRALTPLPGRPAANFLDTLVVDNDTAGVTLTESFAVTDLDEGGSPVGKSCYWVTLTSQPVAPVTINVAPDNVEVATDKAGVTLDAGNWNLIDPGFSNTGNFVCVTPIDDNIIDPPRSPQPCFTGSATMLGAAGSGANRCGTHLGSIGHSATSGDPKYNATSNIVANGADFDGNTTTIDALIRDDDVIKARVLYEPATVNLLEGQTATFRVTLGSKPAADVTVSSELAVLTFAPATWNVPQTVTVSSPQNDTPDAPLTTLFQPTVTSADANFHNPAVAPVEVTVVDDDTAGVLLSGTSLNVSEDGRTATYTLALTAKPAAAVTVSLSADGRLAFAPATLTFNPANWNVPQAVAVSAEDDLVAEGPHTARVKHQVGGDDADFTGVTVSDIVVNIDDNDTAAVTATDTTGLMVGEGELQTATYSLTLQSQPTADVVVTVDGGGRLIAQPKTVTFTAGNWNRPQTVQLTARDNLIDEGIIAPVTLAHRAVSDDPFYQGLETDWVEVLVRDNDTAGLKLSRAVVSAAPGTSATYTVVLTSQPTKNVVIDLVTNGSVDAAADSCIGDEIGTGCVLFTPDNWHVPQTVKVSALGAGHIEHRIESEDAVYGQLSAWRVMVNSSFSLFVPVNGRH